MKERRWLCDGFYGYSSIEDIIRERQADEECCPFVVGVSDFDLSSVVIDDPQYDREPQSRPPVFRCKEGIKDVWQVFFPYSFAAVTHKYAKILPFVPQAHLQLSSVRHLMDCIEEKIGEYLFEL